MRAAAGCSRTAHASLASRDRSTTSTVFASIARTVRTSEWFRSSGRPCLRIASCVNRKSPAVIGVPSLHRAFGRMWYVSVNGDVLVKSTRETSLGRHVKSGPTSNGASRTRAKMRFRCDLRSARPTTLIEGVQARGLRRYLSKNDRAATLRSLRGRSARSRDGEERNGDRRSQRS